MLRYVDVLVTFSEVPDEISLCIDISGCKIHCKECHSSYLWQNIGGDLTLKVLDDLILSNNGITCVCIMGGSDYNHLVQLMKKIKTFYRLKTAWYTGENNINPYIMSNVMFFNYIKTGSYNSRNGPLTSKTTNQVFYEVINNQLINKTYLFWKE